MLQNEKPESKAAGTGWRSRRLPIVSAVVLIAAIMCCLAWRAGLLDSRSIDEQLAAIEAELAIADPENAAVGYMELFTDPANTTILGNLYAHTPSAYVEPWLDSEHPELAAKLEANQEIIQALLDASAMEKAFFPINDGATTGLAIVLWSVRKVAFVLSWSAANDLGEGRPDAAYDKYRCQIQMARHILQQPQTQVKTIGTGYAIAAYRNIRMAAIQDEITAEQLRSLESILEIPMDRGDEFGRISARVDRLLYRRRLSKMSMIERLKQLFRGHKELRRLEKRRQEDRLSMESHRRATVIVLALRRHKERTGAWPASLEQIEPKLPNQTLVDAQNNGSFVYKREGGSFVFHSKGPSGIDEGGSWRGPNGNHPMWPPWKPK
ncbi:MAG: hypothetical protein ACYS7Y_35450 [Planctomycetota bacterium]|jgi:hypothetical protein